MSQIQFVIIRHTDIVIIPFLLVYLQNHIQSLFFVKHAYAVFVALALIRAIHYFMIESSLCNHLDHIMSWIMIPFNQRNRIFQNCHTSTDNCLIFASLIFFSTSPFFSTNNKHYKKALELSPSSKSIFFLVMYKYLCFAPLKILALLSEKLFSYSLSIFD